MNAYYQQSTNSLTVPVDYTIQSIIEKKRLPFLFDEMADEVCSAFGAQRGLVFNKCRRWNVKFARWAIWKILRSHGYTVNDCGAIVGGHDHSSVTNAMNFIDRDICEIEYVGNSWVKVQKYMNGESS
jgi:hypothetical protein